MSEWRPIETVPKDGTWVLLGSFHDDGCGGIYEYGGKPNIAFWSESTKRQVGSGWEVNWQTGSGRIISEGYGSPTHWMPLPGKADLPKEFNNAS